MSAQANLAVVVQAVAWLGSLGDVPALIVGDFNVALDQSGVEGVLAMAGWSDLLRDAGPTCYPTSGAPSRIDRAVANRRAREWLVSAELRWDLGIATHAGLQLDFAAVQPEPALMRVRPRSLEGDPTP
eukprot:8722014-Lingulodinium_polyedra.AAC.1